MTDTETFYVAALEESFNEAGVAVYRATVKRKAKSVKVVEATKVRGGVVSYGIGELTDRVMALGCRKALTTEDVDRLRLTPEEAVLAELDRQEAILARDEAAVRERRALLERLRREALDAGERLAAHAEGAEVKW